MASDEARDVPVEVTAPVVHLTRDDLPAVRAAVEATPGVMVREARLDHGNSELVARLTVRAPSLGTAFDTASDALCRGLEAAPFATTNFFEFRYRLEDQPAQARR
jgi:hypothetical protein